VKDNLTYLARLSEARLQAQVLDAIVRASPDHFYLFDRRGRFLYASPSAALALGVTQADVFGKTWQDLGFPADVMLPLDLHRENVFATGRPWRGEIGFPAADGRGTVVHQYVLSPVRDDDKQITSVMASLRDVTEQKRAEETLKYQALHDDLTGLPNRILLHDRLQQSLFAAERYRASFAVLLIDLDRFKAINDTLGHAAGDLLLQQVGPRWSIVLRTSDTLSRFGGDEFVVLLPATGRSGAEEVAEKLKSATAGGFTLHERAVMVEISLGIAVYPDDGADMRSLLGAADDAMYAMKTAGAGHARHSASSLAP
jgi:diguanylate cyclase (GGDEF)-like protein/PAS domain S-box-containing protein